LGDGEVMSIQDVAKQLKIDKVPLVRPIYRTIQDYWAVNYNREVVIDICTICKSNCVYCLHQRKKLAKPQIMRYEIFCDTLKILEIERYKKIHIFQSGEPFLHPDIGSMIWQISGSDIKLTIGTRLNANITFGILEDSIDKANNTIEFLITIDSIIKMNEISPGMDKKLVIHNIQQLSKLLKYKNVKFTFVSVVSKVNENDIEEVKRFVNSYGFTNWYAESMGYYMWKLAPKSELDMISKFITSNETYKDRFDIVNGQFITKRLHCNAQIPTISPTGDVSICCHDMLHTVNAGNILKEGSLNKIIKSEKYQKLKKLGLNKQLEICRSCN
jgi:MoaA/NifB/PqqE/SkfB family radical SAM enzyme